MKEVRKKEKASEVEVTPANLIHIVFQQADVIVLKKAIELDESLSGDVLEIRDDYAVGPLAALDTEEGWKSRMEWWQSLIDISPYATEGNVGGFDDRMAVGELRKKLETDENLQVWIWMGQNQHDVCGYYWLMSQLKEYHGRILVLYFNNLPFINEKGFIFYPTALHQIQPKEFLKAKKLNRKITLSEFEVDPDEWKKLGTENALIRILEGGKKIVSKEEEFYDKDILAGLTKESVKGNKAMQNILSKMKNKTGDLFLVWRLRRLAVQEQVEIIGDPIKGWKEFEVKLRSIASIEEVETEATGSSISQ
jgi:hypothetical protein